MEFPPCGKGNREGGKNSYNSCYIDKAFFLPISSSAVIAQSAERPSMDLRSQVRNHIEVKFFLKKYFLISIIFTV